MKKKGFTLVELLAVIVVLSIVLMIAVAGYQKYISYTKQKAFNLEEKNFLTAARSAYADCLANKPVNEFCKYHTDLDTKYTYELIYLKELLEDQYIDEIKSPYDSEKSCNPDKSYIYASSKNNLSTSDNSQMEYKVCLVCGDKISEDCLSEEDDYYTFATTCKATYDSTSGTIYDGAWTDRDVYLSFGYEGEIRYGIDEYVYTIGGSNGGQVDANRQTYLANLKISKNVGAKEYKVQAYDGMNGRGNNVSCGVVRVDKAPITNVSVSISAKTTSGTKVNSDTWAMENLVLTANTNPGSSTSGYLYQWYKNGEKFGSQTTSNTLSVTGRGTYKVEVTNRVELAKGTAGKSVMSGDFIVKIDTKKPTCTLAVSSGTVGKNGIYVSDIAIVFSATGDKETDIDQGSGIVSQTIDYSKITDNVMNKVVTGTVKDAVGRTNTCTLTLSKDAITPSVPTITVSDSIASGNWHKNDFTIKLSGASNVSQNEYYYSTNKTNVENANVDNKSNVTTGTTITLNTNTTSAGITYYYKVCSKAGKCSSVGSYLVKLDKNDPVFTVAASDSIASGSWHTANYTVTASGASNVSGNNYYSGTASDPTSTGASQSVSSNSTTANGTTYNFKVCSGAGRCVTKSYVAKLDKSTPSFTVAASDSKASGAWHSANFTITASGAGNVSGNTYYSGTANNPTSTGASQSVSSNTTANGTTYYFKVCSGAGICDTKSYVAKLDKTTPTFTVAASDSKASGAWHSADFTITASGAGNVSGNTYYLGTASNPTATGTSQSVSSNTTSSGTTYYFKVCSGSGICDTKSYVAKLDKSTPSFTVAASDGIASGSWHKANYTITASGASNVSGNTYYYGTSSNPTTTGATQSVSSNISNTTYYFKVCSGAGICSTKSYVAYLDKNAPTCSIAVKSGTAGTNGWYTSNVTVGFSSTNDTGSTVASKSISNGSTSVTDNFVVSTDGTTTLNATVTDSAGNIGTCGPVTVKRDATVPTCSSFAKSNTGTTSGVTLTANCSDNGSSSLAAYYISTSSTKPSASASGWSTTKAVSGKTAGTYYVFAKDNAGNVSTYASATVTAQVQVRSCNSGNSCAAAGYYCPNGGDLSGSTCYTSSTSTYAASSSKSCSKGTLNSTQTACIWEYDDTCTRDYTAMSDVGCNKGLECQGKTNCDVSSTQGSCDTNSASPTYGNCTLYCHSSWTCKKTGSTTPTTNYSCNTGDSLNGQTCTKTTSSSYGASTKSSIDKCGCAAWGGWSNTTSSGSNSNSTQYQTLYN